MNSDGYTESVMLDVRAAVAALMITVSDGGAEVTPAALVHILKTREYLDKIVEWQDEKRRRAEAESETR